MSLLSTVRLLMLAIVLAVLPACSTTGTGSPRGKMVMSELYFGLSKPSGGTVSPREWEHFVEHEIAPRFPDGLTLIDGTGRWRTQNGVTVRENTKILRIVHPATADQHARIDALRKRYMELFGQELVLEVVTPVHAVF
ncbi:MAG TPA: DUF3574 domain-containing protein [Chthoniobacteraceae bacterium]|nr:DUF3574 domain-containing protein [Chthoniobacteraceae bacterium]